MAWPTELWLVDFGDPFPSEPAFIRPAVVVGPAVAFGQATPVVIVAPMTTTHRGLSLHVEVEVSDVTGLESTSYIQCELVRSVSRQRLVRRLGHVEAETWTRVDTVLRRLLDH